MNVEVTPFQLNGCQCRIKFDPKELQTLLDTEIRKKLGKNSKHLDRLSGSLSIGGAFTEIDEGNFAIHFMLAFIGKAWIAGRMLVRYNNLTIVDQPFHISRLFSSFTGGKSQLRGDIKYLADLVVKKP